MRSEINVTPIIDIMLVLLILFMIVTPLTQKGLDVELPPSRQPGSEEASDLQLVLDIDARGDLTINRQPVARDELPSLIRELFDTRIDKSLFLRADRRLRYQEVVAVLDIARGNGVERVGIVPP